MADKRRAIKDDVAISEWVKETFPGGHKRTVHIHLMDYGDPDTANNHGDPDKETAKHRRNLTSRTMANLAKDLRNLSQSTEGVILTCSAQKDKNDVVCQVLEKLWNNTNLLDFHPENPRSLICALCDAKKEPQTCYVHYVLQMDDTTWPPIAKTQCRRVEDIRTTFISEMTKLPRNSLLQTEEEATPVVCMLMDSGERSLSAALMAIRRGIPVIVMKKQTDPGLEFLASQHQQMKLKWERQRVGKTIRYVAVPILDQHGTFKEVHEMSDKVKDLLDKMTEHLHLITIYSAAALDEDQLKALRDVFQRLDARIRGDVNIDDLDAETVKGLNAEIVPALKGQCSDSGVLAALHMFGLNALIPESDLDVVIMEALIINKKEKEMAVFLQSLVQNKDIDHEHSFIEKKSIQWDFFIRSLQNGAASSVKSFLGDLQLDWDYFHFGKVLQLYNSQHRSFIRTGKYREELDVVKDKLVKRFYTARRDLIKFLGIPANSPLRCTGLGCPHCTFTLEDITGCKKNVKVKAEEEFWQTCLHPVQELFLWSLLCSNSDVTTALWEYTKDRMASALFASAVYAGIAKRMKKNKRMDTFNELKEDSRLFKKLAIDTLASCTSLVEQKTLDLLIKPCPWWSPPSTSSGTDRQSCCQDRCCGSQTTELTVLDVAIKTKCKAFIAKQMCDQILSRHWTETQKDMTLPQLSKESENMEEEEEIDQTCQKDMTLPQLPKKSEKMEEEGIHQTSQKDMPKKETPKTCNSCKSKCDPRQLAKFLRSPRGHFAFCILGRIGFILLYSYVLLMGLTGTWDPSNIALIIWVADIFGEEIRQWLSVGVKTEPTACCVPVRKHFHVFMKKSVGYISEGWNILDAISIFSFILGAGLAFCPHDTTAHDAGRLILSADIVVFILRFLQVFMYFKELGLWLVVARKMVWDTARFMLILLSMTYGYAVASEALLNKEKTWPYLYHVAQKSFFSMFGEFFLESIEQTEDASTWKWVPVYLGFFVLATNVLLLNLLIARLSSRYTEMEGKAIEYRAWMKYQVFQEIQNRSWFPPPFNILYALVALVITICCSLIKRRSPASGGGRCSSCHRQQRTAVSGGRGSYCGCLEMQTTDREGQSQTGWQQESQMLGTCLNVWNNEGTSDEDITVSTKTSMNFKLKTKKFKLHKKRHLLIWKSHPTEVIEIDGNEPKYTDQEKHIQYSQLDTFEKKQAEWAIQQIGLRDSAQ